MFMVAFLIGLYCKYAMGFKPYGGKAPGIKSGVKGNFLYYY